MPRLNFSPARSVMRTQWATLVFSAIVGCFPLIAATGAWADDQGPVAAPQASADAMTADKLDELLAPIALYPDPLLAQIFAASAYPQEVMDGGNWLPDNAKLQGPALQDAAKEAGFGPAMQALVLFPTVIDMMCQNFDWTKQLGSAFNTDQGAVFASVQRLRAQAQEVGNLKSSEQMTVQTQTVDAQKVIVIQPTNPTTIYVPVYNPQVVYVPAPPPPPGPSSSDVAAAAIFGFAAGIIVGSIFTSNNYYPYPNWGYGGIYYGGRPYYHNVYVYRPNYHYHYPPGYRPGGGYRPPPGYGGGWPRPTPYRGSGNNYYNQFRGNQNLRPGAPRPKPLVPPNVGNRPGAYKPPPRPPGGGNGPGGAGNRLGQGNGNNNGGGAGNKPGQGNGNNNGGAGKPGQGNGNNNGGAGKPGQGAGNGNNNGGAGNKPGQGTPSTRPATPGAVNPGSKGQSTYRNAKPATDRGFGGTNPSRPQPSKPTQGAQPSRNPPAQQSRPTQPAQQSRPAPQQSRPAPQTRPSPSSTGTSGMGTFGNRGQTSGAQDKAAANRGRASAGSGNVRPVQNNQQGKRGSK
jgi:hypothetical protein